MSVDDADVLPVTPAVIQWARSRAGFQLEDAQKYFKRIAAWEKGDATPSYAQLEQMAEKFKCPVAVFFFPAPPTLPEVQGSFRTLSAEDFALIPRTVKALLRKAQAMQMNLAELNDGRNPADRLITRDLRFDIETPVQAVAEAIRNYLGISFEQQKSWPSAEEALEHWRDALAGVGIFAFKDPFHAPGYFGFCIYDDDFPVIYVNNSSAKTRQIFTLFHELGHLLFHTSGIDVVDESYIQKLPDELHQLEVLCNKLAGEFLVSDREFEQQMANRSPSRDSATSVANLYCVSREVVYRKMLNRGWISTEEYAAAAKAWAAQGKPSSGGDYYYNQIAYLGRRYVDLAFKRYYQQRFDEAQLSDYLNIKPRYLPAFEMKYGSGS